ncbi:single-stranded DNA-binding protein [Hathewaya histolytica]|uniref:single-stranded DNA-binding protein n=1 Tax=Hathewaya histolytica TaxID=1498 RepID=UPI003B6716FA
MNKTVLVGRLVADPELKFTPGAGTAVTTFTLAVNRRFKKEGQPEADFIPIVIWGKMAESTANYKRKGEMIGISGRIETRSYEAKDGTRRYVTEVIAEEVEFIGSKKDGQATEQQQNTWENSYTEVDDDDIPF